MKRRTYGRDAGLTLRMLATSGLLGLLYVAFGAVLISYLNVGIVPMVLIIAGIAFFQYFTSDKLALRASGAKVVSEAEAPALHAMVERLCAMADLPKPKVAIIDTDVPNAFATGRNPKHSAVAVTRGLAGARAARGRGCDRARALAHREPDVLIMTLASFFAMLAGLLTRYAFFFGGGGRDRNGPPVWLVVFLVSVVTYIVSYVLIRTISRYREYSADRGAALITGAPENLMSALQKIASGIASIPQRDLREVQAMNAFFIIPTNVKSAFGWICTAWTRSSGSKARAIPGSRSCTRKKPTSAA